MSTPDPPRAARSRGVRAAGTLPWRVTDGRLQVALVHRPRYDDWAWPKGKLDRGETPVRAAVRETLEETGLQVRAGLPLPGATYRVGSSAKNVDYWSASVVADTGTGPQSAHEVDALVWTGLEDAVSRLTYARDAVQLATLARAHREGTLDTWPLLLVRHAHAKPRSGWKPPDPERPLDTTGRRRARTLEPILASYRPLKALTSPSVRCRDTVAPWAESHGIELADKRGLSEEGHAARPDRAARHLRQALDRAQPVVLCTHGPVLPDLLQVLAAHGTGGSPEAALLNDLREDNLDKGEALVLHVRGSGDEARVIALERHRPRKA